MPKPVLYILSLGGTILSASTSSVEPFYSSPSLDIFHIISQLPNDINHLVELRYKTLSHVLSHNMSEDLLFLLANEMQQCISDPEVVGIVVTMGTNALEEVAYFIHLVIQTDKPIVFTGAMKPTNALGYDGIRNLYNAIMLANSKEAMNKGVLITFNDCITSARDTVKLNPGLIHDFAGNDFALLGYMHGSRPYFYRDPVMSAHTFQFPLDQIKTFSLIYILYAYLGADNILVEAAIQNSVRGIISAGMGNGHQPIKTTQALAKASAQGIIIIRCSRSGMGMIQHDKNTDDQYGFIPGGTLTPQKARILLAVALNVTHSPKDIATIFQES